MNKEQWHRIRAVFDHVVDKSPSHRADYLDIVCEDDPELRQEIELLLTANDSIAEGASIGFQLGAEKESTPEQVGEYKINCLLGTGGMGSVYDSTHPRFGTVALKLLPAFLVNDPIAQLRFRKEAQVLARLDHPALCTLYDSFVREDFAGIAMELVLGEELGSVIEKAPLGGATAVRYVRIVAEILAKAHLQGVFHRDIKPSNIIVTGRETLKLIDFGIAKFADFKLTATGQAIGSPHYMSPEQWQGTQVDGRTDLWSLGVLWYEMLSGRHPFGGSTLLDVAAAVFTEEPSPLPGRCVDGQLLEETSIVINKLLNKEPQKRFASCEELIARIDDLK